MCIKISHSVEFPKLATELKGVQGENCNVTHCQAPKSAFHFNSVTKAWYCRSCAARIESAAKRDGMSFYADLNSGDVCGHFHG